MSAIISSVKNYGRVKMISVVICVYKDEMYIEQQIKSILPQLGAKDEIIVCDEKIGSRTENIINRIALEDPRVLFIEGKGKGKNYSFVNAVRHSKGDLIFVCEKGNVWLPDKVKRVKEAFSEGADLVLHNAYVTDENLNITDYSLFNKFNLKKSVIGNAKHNTFSASCICFKRPLLKYILPVPKAVANYDQWIALVALSSANVKYIDIPLIYYRDIQRDKTQLDMSYRKKGQKPSYLLTRLFRRKYIEK